MGVSKVYISLDYLELNLDERQEVEKKICKQLKDTYADETFAPIDHTTAILLDCGKYIDEHATRVARVAIEMADADYVVIPNNNRTLFTVRDDCLLAEIFHKQLIGIDFPAKNK